MNRIFLDQNLETNERLDLPTQAARHLAGALRARAGDELIVFNGRGGEFRAVIEAVGRRSVTVLVGEHDAVERESPLLITLAQGLSRGERMDFSIQKAVELGVSRIVPFAARRSNAKLLPDRAQNRLGHWQSIVRHACEQSGRNKVPDVSPRDTLEAVLADEICTLRIALDPTGSDRLEDIDPPTGTLLLVIGPEGGFDPAELEMLDSAGCLRVPLGPRILRTETATIAGLTLLQTRFGDFSGSA